jgi:hypothetical protein
MDNRIVSTPQRRSRKQEERGAAAHDAVVTPGSGSGTVKNDARSPADGRAWPESIEFKTTGNIQFVLKLDELVLAARNAVADDRMPGFGVEFTHARGGASWRYVILEESDYLELIARARGA